MKLYCENSVICLCWDDRWYYFCDVDSKWYPTRPIVTKNELFEIKVYDESFIVQSLNIDNENIIFAMKILNTLFKIHGLADQFEIRLDKCRTEKLNTTKEICDYTGKEYKLVFLNTIFRTDWCKDITYRSNHDGEWQKYVTV